jgi:hypothetical protein
MAYDNESILKLVRAGMAEDTIIHAINTQSGRYALGADDLIALRQAGVSEKILAAILQRNAAPLSAAAPADADAVTEVGIYFQIDGAWRQLMPEVANWKSGGVLKSLVTIGLVKGDINGRINGRSSPNAVHTPVEILVCLPSGVVVTEYQLLKLREHEDGRDFRTFTGGVFHQSGGATRDLIPFEFKKVDTRKYLVPLTQLKAGEYGILPPGAMLSSHASAQLGKIYTFRIGE